MRGVARISILDIFTTASAFLRSSHSNWKEVGKPRHLVHGFTAARLDEATDTIGVAPPDVKELCDAIVASSLELGRAPRTATSYANAWRRLAGIESGLTDSTSLD